ncbi:MAG: HAMP domain-containing histidine kinase [Eubacterium sp.]|nr:HAMP domain-containing histidine kinase [Eubacterium sp.]MCI8918022.1 HAMP domain-containing histidine kinase [Eubacterium sp.]
MYQKIHRHLTLLFTGITSLILITMSISYLYMSEHALSKNSFLSFTSEVNTILSNFEQQSTLTYEWLAKVSSNGKYLIAAYDHDVPLSYTTTALSEKELALVDNIMKNRETLIRSIPPSGMLTSTHKEFTYTSSDKEHYYACYAEIGRTLGNLTVLLLYPAKKLYSQIFYSRICFLVINLSGILLIFLFSWHYTKKLLTPIRLSQQQQADFIAAASHELRTPLSVILSSISALKCAPPAAQGRFLHTIEVESSRMSRLITDLLTLARSDSRSWSFHIKETDLDTLLLNACEAFQPLAAQKQITLHIDLPEESFPACPCDPERISQVFGILISNALSYGYAGGSATLKLSYKKGVFSCYVIDNGIGISKEAKAHIFDRFYRADASRSKKEHFGLGLSIAKEIIESHHGNITVADTPGGGTTFLIQLYVNDKKHKV